MSIHSHEPFEFIVSKFNHDANSILVESIIWRSKIWSTNIFDAMGESTAATSSRGYGEVPGLLLGDFLYFSQPSRHNEADARLILRMAMTGVTCAVYTEGIDHSAALFRSLWRNLLAIWRRPMDPSWTWMCWWSWWLPKKIKDVLYSTLTCLVIRGTMGQNREVSLRHHSHGRTLLRHKSVWLTFSEIQLADSEALLGHNLLVETEHQIIFMLRGDWLGDCSRQRKAPGGHLHLWVRRMTNLQWRFKYLQATFQLPRSLFLTTAWQKQCL